MPLFLASLAAIAFAAQTLAPGQAAAEKGRRLPPGGGEPGRAYMAYNKALRGADLEGLRKTDATLAEASAKDLDEIRPLLRLMSAGAPADLKILGGTGDRGVAMLELEAVVMGEKKKGWAEMKLLAGSWKVVRDGWK